MATPFDDFTPEAVARRSFLGFVDAITTYPKTTVAVLVALLGGTYFAVGGSIPFLE